MSDAHELVNVALPSAEAYQRPIRPEIAPLVRGRAAALPVDERGYPVPAFVPWIDGKPEFRTASVHFRARAIRESLCWVCGGKLGVFKAFVIGPMCVLNLTTSEPPCHFDCAEFSAKACPFLTKPHMTRRENDLPPSSPAPGFAIDRNPGAVALWVCEGDALTLFPDGKGKTLLRIAEPARVCWFASGRPARRADVLRPILTGLPILMSVVPSEHVDEAANEIASRFIAIEKWLPQE